MAGGVARRDRFELPDSVRRFFEGDWESAALRVEEYHEGDTLVVKAEMPGIDPDKDVDISVSDGVLHIQAERQETSEHKEKGGYRTEFRYGSFARDIPLPSGSKDSDVSASYRDGVLEVRVPVAEREQTTSKIQVTRG
ncbi:MULTISPECIES: Hsp20/alpha crystallin family protein [unclassified Cryobacterium]|uniref:Hsp20/alpha crystallin family protein n=1 Tax=unclassified Cryobacterium TaxID=2649013 RepID=UPI00106C8605|nr:MULTISPECIES: Hsp20/alpha crystallin family protein [unclassified Cryobacterium]TFC58652.1 Hsp20/alpha crystallin family protein [Cryobacterium sp. TMB3-1-2]TFC67073.1 Hsp20/alpha crystallin family protein [Cryobacterium sp. TMB3-15]TFC73414.1 Hsp20/alpha crystallin family protein [Cryobacterium sp. TMB3-10]TFC86506.1 Hsp20/alpha crystallin family protein [Cryobacterium sp. TMT4-31]TFD44113.1 Hsp20/alpha crystallin family protein [Cryobacterium sp. TMB3-12]